MIYFWATFGQSLSWLINHETGAIRYLIQPLLAYEPSSALSFLITEADGDNRPLNANPDHPHRVIDDWTSDLRVSPEEIWRRRNILLQAVVKQLQLNQSVKTAIHCIKYIFSPYASGHWSGPTDFQVTFSQGHLPFAIIERLPNLWNNFLTDLDPNSIADWTPFLDVLNDWAFNMLPNISLTEEVHKVRKELAARIANDLLNLSSEQPGVAYQIKYSCTRAGIEVVVDTDPVFETLFPMFDIDNWERTEQMATKRVKTLAETWAYRDPVEVIEDVRRYRLSATKANVSEGNTIAFLFERISLLVSNYQRWLDALYATPLHGNLAVLFLRKLYQSDKPIWEQHIVKSLKSGILASDAVRSILEADNVSPRIIEEFLEVAPEFSRLIEICPPKDIKLVKSILVHPHRHVVEAVALAEWVLVDPRKEGVREELVERWEDAVITSFSKDHWLNHVLERNPHLAYRLCHYRFTTDETFDYRFEKTISTLAKLLSSEEKLLIISDLDPKRYKSPVLATMLLGGDVETYEILIKRQDLSAYHLLPLSFQVLEHDDLMILAALSTGYQIEEIFKAIIHPALLVVGFTKYSRVIRGKIQIFEDLMEHSDIGLRQLGKYGIERLKLVYQAELQNEYNEEVFGLD